MSDPILFVPTVLRDSAPERMTAPAILAEDCRLLAAFLDPATGIRLVSIVIRPPGGSEIPTHPWAVLDAVTDRQKAVRAGQISLADGLTIRLVVNGLPFTAGSDGRAYVPEISAPRGSAVSLEIDGRGIRASGFRRVVNAALFCGPPRFRPPSPGS